MIPNYDFKRFNANKIPTENVSMRFLFRRHGTKYNEVAKRIGVFVFVVKYCKTPFDDVIR